MADLSNIPKRPLIIAILVVVIGGAVFLIAANFKGADTRKVELDVWGTFDEAEVRMITEAYTEVQGNVKIKYQKFSEANYEKALLNAFASGTGPDIFLMRNRWLPKELGKIVPAPQDKMTAAQVQALFPTVVEQDFVSGARVYALPLYLDTLVLLYNKNIFDQNAVTKPPATWQEFQNLIPSLRSISRTNQILKAGAAIGGSTKTIGPAVDLLHLLMMQNGTPMMNAQKTSPAFIAEDKGAPGVAAMNFYLQFANAGSPYYTWNDNQENDVDTFASGNMAMMFGYQRTIPKIREKSPFLTIGVQPMLQPSGSELHVNYADYWGFAVSRASREAATAWDFVIFATTNVKNARAYMEFTGRPPALRVLVNERLNDPELGVFARQALTARSWYQADDVEITEIFSRAITRVLTGQANVLTALKESEAQVTQLLRQ